VLECLPRKSSKCEALCLNLQYWREREEGEERQRERERERERGRIAEEGREVMETYQEGLSVSL
jgi:hypothetical protein